MRSLLAGLLLFLAGCGQTTTADVVRVLVWPIPVPDSWFGPPSTDRAARWDRGEAAAPPGRPALLVSLRQRQAVALLHQTQGERRLWRSAGGLVVATDGARVVATSGLEDSLAATRFEGPDPLAAPLELTGEDRGTRRVVDLMRRGRQPDGMRFGLIIDCTLRRAEATEEVVMVEERCRGDATFTNRFWADPRSGAIFRSEQWIGPRLPMLAVEVLTPPPSN
jgi:hypothetical protein